MHFRVGTAPTNANLSFPFAIAVTIAKLGSNLRHHPTPSPKHLYIPPSGSLHLLCWEDGTRQPVNGHEGTKDRGRIGGGAAP